MPIFVNKSKCSQNHPCPAVKICPGRALNQEKFNAPWVDKEKCIKCGICSNFCPMGALELK